MPNVNARKQFQAAFSNVAAAQVTVDPGADSDIDVTVPGAQVGDVVLCGPGVDVGDSQFTAAVTAANTVSINWIGADVASSVWNVVCLRPSFGN
jgi:hypothetical protein